MERHDEAKLSILKSIESLSKANHLYPSNKISRISDTSLISYKKQIETPPQIVLIQSGLIRLLMFKSKHKTEIILDRKGISYNETLFQWNDILTTHFEEIAYPRDDNDSELYLILGLSSGELKTLDFSKVNFKGAFIRPLNIKKLASYIEHYKNNSR